MKKIMVVLAAIVLGFAAHASVVDWKYSITGATKGATTYDGATAYLVAASDWAALSAGDVTAAALAGVAKDSSAMVSKTTTKTAWYTADAGGTANMTRAVDLGSAIDPGSSYAAKIIIVSGDKYMVADAGLTTRDAAGSTAGTTSFSITAANAAAATWSSFGGGSEGVPEPTSGLLLLVGGALLALRRKQK